MGKNDKYEIVLEQDDLRRSTNSVIAPLKNQEFLVPANGIEVFIKRALLASLPRGQVLNPHEFSNVLKCDIMELPKNSEEQKTWRAKFSKNDKDYEIKRETWRVVTVLFSLKDLPGCADFYESGEEATETRSLRLYLKKKTDEHFELISISTNQPLFKHLLLGDMRALAGCLQGGAALSFEEESLWSQFIEKWRSVSPTRKVLAGVSITFGLVAIVVGVWFPPIGVIGGKVAVSSLLTYGGAGLAGVTAVGHTVDIARRGAGVAIPPIDPVYREHRLSSTYGLVGKALPPVTAATDVALSAVEEEDGNSLGNGDVDSKPANGGFVDVALTTPASGAVVLAEGREQSLRR